MLELIDINKSFQPGTPVLQDVSLQVNAGEIVCLLGPSGCGKTTLLRVVAGLESAESGRILFDGEGLADLPVHRRNFGLMFQEYALFPHKSVGENIAFGLRMAGESAAEIDRRVAAMLELVNLDGYANRTIFELSGGERQRVALARSLAPNPRLLMLDEPLGSLDRALREELMIELRTVLKQVGVTALYVTHDQQEAYAVADRLVVMRDGRIAQIGTPEAVYAQPQSEFVARFLGFSNLLPAHISTAASSVLETPIGPVSVGEVAARQTLKPGDYWLLLRPEAIRPNGPNNSQSPRRKIDATVERSSFRGSHYRVEATIDAPGEVHKITFDVPAQSAQAVSLNGLNARPEVGQRVQLGIETGRLAVLPREMGSTVTRPGPAA